MDPKTRGIVAYLTIIGWVIALITNNPKDEQTTFHLRQMLGLMLFSLGGMFLGIIPVLSLILYPLYLLGIFVLWIFGLISAIEGTRKPVPLLGDYFQDWFKNL